MYPRILTITAVVAFVLAAGGSAFAVANSVSTSPDAAFISRIDKSIVTQQQAERESERHTTHDAPPTSTPASTAATIDDHRDHHRDDHRDSEPPVTVDDHRDDHRDSEPPVTVDDHAAVGTDSGPSADMTPSTVDDHSVNDNRDSSRSGSPESSHD
jgi:hypothetical protein